MTHLWDEYTQECIKAMSGIKKPLEFVEAAKELLNILYKITKHAADINYAVYVDGKKNALLRAMNGQKELLADSRKAITRFEELLGGQSE